MQLQNMLIGLSMIFHFEKLLHPHLSYHLVFFFIESVSKETFPNNVHCEFLFYANLEFFRYFKFWLDKYKKDVLIISRQYEHVTEIQLL